MHSVVVSGEESRMENTVKTACHICYVQYGNASHTRYRALGPELIPVYRQCQTFTSCSDSGLGHVVLPAARLRGRLSVGGGAVRRDLTVDVDRRSAV